MTRPFAALERFFERLFERPAARLFHTPLQPVQFERRLERSMEAGRSFSGDRTYVPNRYRVLLNPEDFKGFSGYRSRIEADLSDALHDRARARGYRLLDRPAVHLEMSRRVEAGDFEVFAELVEPPADPGRVPGRDRHANGVPNRDAASAVGPAAPASVAAVPSGGPGGDATGAFVSAGGAFRQVSPPAGQQQANGNEPPGRNWMPSQPPEPQPAYAVSATGPHPLVSATRPPPIISATGPPPSVAYPLPPVAYPAPYAPPLQGSQPPFVPDSGRVPAPPGPGSRPPPAVASPSVAGHPPGWGGQPVPPAAFPGAPPWTGPAAASPSAAVQAGPPSGPPRAIALPGGGGIPGAHDGRGVGPGALQWTGPPAVVEVVLGDGSRTRFAYRGGTARVGRATDNEIVVSDERVSRHHGQFLARQGTLVYTDLGSTNGSFVNGTRVREIAVGTGDTVRLGSAAMTVRPPA